MRRGRPKGSTNHKTEVRRAREFQRWLAKLITLHLSNARVVAAKAYDPGRRLTIDLATGRVVKPARKKRRKTTKSRKARRARRFGKRKFTVKAGDLPSPFPRKPRKSAKPTRENTTESVGRV